jgi:peroxiredoxin
MKKITLSILLALLTISAFPLINAGIKMPDFKVMDGNEKWLNSNELKGKVITIFYEDKDKVKENRELKKYLNKYYDENISITEKNVVRLAVIDASPSNALTRWIWRRKMRNASVEEKLTVYGDWDASMRKSFEIPEEAIAFLIVDKKGIIRYTKIGKIQNTEFDKIKQLLTEVTLAN